MFAGAPDNIVYCQILSASLLRALQCVENFFYTLMYSQATNRNDFGGKQYERGYFRSPGRGGFFSKKRRRKFSRSRMTLRVGAIERCMFVIIISEFLWNRQT